MTVRRLLILMPVVLLLSAPALAQEPDAAQIKQEREQAELEAPQIMDVLGIKPGMTIADIGSGGGAMTVVIGRLIGTGKVFATDITERARRETREYAEREGLKNVTVLEGAAAATNLPASCCDAAFMRDVYHHVTDVDAFNKSLLATVKPGGSLAVIDFRPMPNSKVPAGVRENRGGHGIPPEIVIEELTAAGFKYVRTIEKWPPGDKRPGLYLTLFTKDQ
jgi:ubiquinone/menaquinone biosynthesis C-methylase UbiE